MVGPIVTLTTDFGWGSGYVAQLKAAVLEACPGARLVDINHGVSAQNIAEAGFLMRQIAFAFGPAAVHLVVVDPGVGTARRAIACKARGTFFVGPDNGVLSVALEQSGCEVVEIDAPHLYRRPLSATFHGRDIFAPVAADLAGGLTLREIGPPLTEPVILQVSQPEVADDGSIQGEVVYADSFGNLITNVEASSLPLWEKVTVNGLVCERVQTYGAVAAGTLCALVGSGGMIEVAVSQGSAARRLSGEVVGLAVNVSGQREDSDG